MMDTDIIDPRLIQERMWQRPIQENRIQMATNSEREVTDRHVNISINKKT